MNEVTNNAAQERYELATDSGTATAAYVHDGDILVFTHTAVPAALQGRGVGTRLVEGMLADIRARGLKIVPQCPFVADYVDRHPEVRDLLAED